MNKYQQFIFEAYDFNMTEKRLTLRYSLDGTINFAETYTFKFDFAEYIDMSLLDVAFQTLFFMAGISYYKTYLPPEIIIKQGVMDQDSSIFFSKTYQRGLGEFFYVNKLDPRTVVTIPATRENTRAPANLKQLRGILIGIGGGKDSLVSVELLRNHADVATWSVGHQQQLAPLIERIGLPHLQIDREWDKQLLELNNSGAYNGHIPISGILAAAGIVAAVLSGKRDVVVSNEASANEPTLEYDGVQINHQYSKSLEFEQDFQSYLEHHTAGAVRYYSLLRPYSELRIAEMFAESGFETYADVFSSCNRAFRHTSDHMFWCGECAKCAFVFMALSPFIENRRLEQLWSGNNLLLKPALDSTYRQLLGIEGNKPLDCVGEVKESRAAMRLAQQQYPELLKYEFDLPEGYDFRSAAPDSIPADVIALLKN